MTTVGSGMTDDVGALHERKRLFDDIWLLTLFVIFIALATPWFLRVLDVDFAPLAWRISAMRNPPPICTSSPLEMTISLRCSRFDVRRRMLRVVK